MTRERQKQAERFRVDRFIAASGLSLEVEQLDPQLVFPDAVLRFEGSRVGLEVTDYHRRLPLEGTGGSALREEHELKLQVIRRARELHGQSSAAPVAVQVRFKSRRESAIQAANRNSVAVALAGFVEGLSDLDSAFKRYDAHAEPGLPDPIQAVYVRSADPRERLTWQLAEAHTTGPYDSAGLEESIRKKNERLGEYRQVITPCWLLIVADATSPAGTMLVPGPGEVDLTASMFDRTFLFIEPYSALIDSDMPPNPPLHTAGASRRR